MALVLWTLLSLFRGFFRGLVTVAFWYFPEGDVTSSFSSPDFRLPQNATSQKGRQIAATLVLLVLVVVLDHKGGFLPEFLRSQFSASRKFDIWTTLCEIYGNLRHVECQSPWEETYKDRSDDLKLEIFLRDETGR